MEYIIPIHGIIGSPERKGDKNQYFTYNDFLMHLSKSKSADTIILDINSLGGYCDVADKIINELQKTGKVISAYNSGDVASAATKIFTIAQRDLRVYYPQKGIFMIHNPWVSMDGDANELIDMAISLKETELEYVNWYYENTGTDKEIISSVMAENINLTPKQVEELGFANVVYPTINAFAKLKNNNKIEMDEKVIEKLNVFEKLLNKIIGKKSLLIVDGSGNELDVPEITDIAELVVGLQVTIGGEKITGDYTLNDGTIIKIEGGIITEIVAVEPVETETETETEITLETTAVLSPEEQKMIDDLTAENEELKKKIAELEGTSTDTQAKFEQLAKDFKEIKALSSNHKTKSDKPEVEENVKKSFSYNKEKLKQDSLSKLNEINSKR